jgi:phosphohistidine phosphatase
MDTSATHAATQRRLIILRHAKAMEDDAGGDHARSLSPRGHEDAANLGLWLKQQSLGTPQVYCSTASRTRQTLGALQTDWPAILSDKLYLASAGEMLALVQQADDANHTIMLIAHNPGLHGLLAFLTGQCATAADEDRLLLKFPTCALAVLEFSLPHWAGIAPKSGTLTTLRFAQ